MDALAWIVVVGAALLTVATVVWFVTARAHPEAASGHLDDPPGGVARRPAGPAAEPMNADEPGGRTVVEPSAGELGPDSGRHVTGDPTGEITPGREHARRDRPGGPGRG